MDNNMQESLVAMRSFFESGQTKTFAYRKAQLTLLRNAILEYENEIYEALYTDLGKPKEETWVTETGMVLNEINHAISNLQKWMKPQRTGTNLVNLPSSSYTIAEPLGVVLIIGPWNYPFQLLFNPLVGAIASGNCTVLKPSEFAPATAAIMEKIITKNFAPQYILYTKGDGAVVLPPIMKQFRFDHIFYTGSTAVGKIIYQMAAERLVPVTLELGGKSPCVVAADANIKVAAKRIAIAKFSNCGQMCVTPDYLLVHESIKEKFIQVLVQTIESFFSANASTNKGYGRMINERQFERVIKYLEQGKIIYGGKNDKTSLYIQPTLLGGVSLGAPVMMEEIFGPILPILTYSTNDEALNIVNRNPNPLAFYIYSESKSEQEYWMNTVAFGGGCINNSSWHLTNHNLPFGGRGFSGTGKYHGKYSFETFSHIKAIMKTPTWFDPAIKYPPFEGKLGLFKKIM